jgi:hypothetical protein
MGSVDLIDYQVGRREVPNFQVGRGKEMRLSESLRSSEVGSGQQGVLIGEDSCGFVDHVNEDDEKLNTLTIKEEDQRSILIIGGIKTFLPNNQVEASAHDESAAKKGKTTNKNCQRGRNGVDTDVYPNRRRRAFNRIAQNFQPGS